MKLLCVLLTITLTLSSVSLAKPLSDPQEIIQKLRQTYPGAVIQQVSLEELKSIRQTYSKNNRVMLEREPTILYAQNSEEHTQELPLKKTVQNADHEKENQLEQQQNAQENFQAMPYQDPAESIGDEIEYETEKRVRRSLFMRVSGNMDARDAAIILLVFIGIFMVAVLILDAGIILYEVVIEGKQYPVWMDLSGTFSGFLQESKQTSGDTGEQVLVSESALFTGMKLSTGFIKGPIGIGLTSEIGYLNFDLQVNQDITNHLKNDGGYGVIGPAIRIFFDRQDPTSSHLFTEILAGTSNLNEVGLISIARLGVNAVLKATSHHRFLAGVNMGALYFNLKEEEGFVRRQGKLNDNFDLIYGIELGYQF